MEMLERKKGKDSQVRLKQNKGYLLLVSNSFLILLRHATSVLQDYSVINFLTYEILRTVYESSSYADRYRGWINLSKLRDSNFTIFDRHSS